MFGVNFIGMLVPGRCVMSRIPMIVAAFVVGAPFGAFQAHASDLTPGEARARPNALTVGLLQPWEINWRHTAAWQVAGTKPRASFAPPGCYVARLVTTCRKTSLQREYVCR